MLDLNRSRAILLVALLAPLGRGAPEELPHDVLVLRDIRQHMTQTLSRLPSYTCLETIARGQHAPERFIIAVPGKSVPFRRMDVVRLEVAEVNNVELFAYPGAHNFEKKELREWVKGGLMGNGMFSGFAHDAFSSNAATYKWIGEEKMDGRSLLHYDFAVPLLLSGYNVGSDSGHALVAYRGSFWIDPQTYDVVRLDAIADDIPAFTRLSDVHNRIDFARVRIGENDALLPQSAELTTQSLEGWSSRNSIAFTHCREYGVEAVIHFDDAPEGEGGKAGSNQVDMPAGVQISMELETAIDSKSARVGDLLSAHVDVEVRHKGKVVIPKGAVITGRLRRLEEHLEGFPYVLAGLEFLQLEFDGKTARFFAVLEKALPGPSGQSPKRISNSDLPGVGIVSAMGNQLTIPAGTRLVWKTISYEQAAEAGEAVKK